MLSISPRVGKGNKDHFLIIFDGTTAEAFDKAQEIRRQIAGVIKVTGSPIPSTPSTVSRE